MNRLLNAEIIELLDRIMEVKTCYDSGGERIVEIVSDYSTDPCDYECNAMDDIYSLPELIGQDYLNYNAEPIHVVGDTNAKEACITEGAMKGDIVSVLTNGRLFIAVPGVNSIANLPGVIRELGITKVYESFDMDKRSKPEVKRALISLRKTLDAMNVEWEGCSWNPKYKGLDDYYLAKTLWMKNAAPVAA